MATGTAQANELRDVWGPGALHPLLPPKEYDHPFAGELLVIDELEPQAMRDNCDSQWRDKELAGCVYHLREANTDRCIVLLTKEVRDRKERHLHGRYGLAPRDRSLQRLASNP